MFKPDVIEEIGTVAAEFGLEPVALLAVAEIESGGQAYALMEGRREPLIRFEGHYFDRRLSAESRARARSLGLSAPTAGAVANPAAQAARWKMLDRAAAIDRKAAWESTSWGLGQVMGAHWAWLGFASVDALVAEARASVAGQARLMARYIVKAGLADALRRRDWAAFARGYNGSGYRSNRYDAKLARAFARYSSPSGATEPRVTASTAPTALRRGDRGAPVANLQAALSAAGYPVRRDGVFGPGTADAVMRFQRDHDLTLDGVAGARTLAALQRSLSFWSRLRLLWDGVSAAFRRRGAPAA